MIHHNVWEMEEINWFNPHNPDQVQDRHDRRIEEPIGLTPNQLSHKAGNTFQVMQFMSPGRFLDTVDLTFDPHRSKTLDFLYEAVDAGRWFAPLQMWLTFDEYLYWPEIYRSWSYEKGSIRRRIRQGEEVPFEQARKVILQHEGRHRAWFAREIGETTVPVTVWIKEPR